MSATVIVANGDLNMQYVKELQRIGVSTISSARFPNILEKNNMQASIYVLDQAEQEEDNFHYLKKFTQRMNQCNIVVAKSPKTLFNDIIRQYKNWKMEPTVFD